MEPTLTQTEIVRAFTNTPVLAKNQVVLGDRTFPIVDLPYDDYLVFFSLLSPLFNVVAGLGVFSGMVGDVVEDMTPQSLLKYCGQELPQLAQICLKQSDPTITVEDVKKISNPFKLATVVLKQIEQNNMLVDIKDFFELTLPLMQKLSPMTTTTEETL